MSYSPSEFEAAAYSYRSWPAHDLPGVAAAFKRLQDVVEDMIAEAVQSERESLEAFNREHNYE